VGAAAKCGAGATSANIRELIGKFAIVWITWLVLNRYSPDFRRLLRMAQSRSADVAGG
jgi:hypothetical protein